MSNTSKQACHIAASFASITQTLATNPNNMPTRVSPFFNLGASTDRRHDSLFTPIRFVVLNSKKVKLSCWAGLLAFLKASATESDKSARERFESFLDALMFDFSDKILQYSVTRISHK